MQGSLIVSCELRYSFMQKLKSFSRRHHWCDQEICAQKGVVASDAKQEVRGLLRDGSYLSLHIIRSRSILCEKVNAPRWGQGIGELAQDVTTKWDVSTVVEDRVTEKYKVGHGVSAKGNK